MNILICSFSFPPRPGGVSQVTRAHARGLVQRGHEVTVATEDVSDQHGIDFPADFKVLQFKVSGNANPRSRYDGDIDEYLSFIGSFTGDLICCHCWQTWSTDLAIKAFSKTRSRKILVSHGVSANTKLGWPRAFPTWLLWRPYVLWEMPTILKAFDHLILLSDRSDKDRFYDRYMADRMGYRNISVIPNGVDLHAHDKAPSDFRVRYGIDTQRLVLCVGSYYDLKNQKMALEAFISANPADTTLVFIGPSKNRYTLEIENRWAQTKKTLAGARMICLDSLSMETILSAYKTADLYLCSSRTECFPLAILDAMASKTPFISTDVGCIRDLPGGIVKGISDRIRRILLAGTGQYEWYTSAWVRALRALDLEVIHYDWTEHWSKGVLGNFERRFMYGPALYRINQTLIELAADVKPDLVLIFAGMPIWPGTIKSLRRDYWVAGYHNDDPFGSNGDRSYFRIFKNAIPFYCSHHVYRQENIQEYQRLGIKHVKQLKSYYLPWIDQPPELTSEDRGCFGHEIVFVGHAEKDARIEYIRDLLEAGLPLKLFGEEKYWRRYLPAQIYRRLSPIREVFNTDYRKVLAGSNICLCFLSERNRDQYTRRVFEIPACGRLLMCQRTDVMRELYEEGIEAEYFSSSEELIRKCRFYLEHNHLREGIAAAGHRRCIESGYDVVSRMRQWLADTSGFMEKGL